MADTRRDIITKVKIAGAGVSNLICGLEGIPAADPTSAGSAQKAYVDGVNALVAAITASMAAYGAAAP